tara:strand:- start:1346 stop:1663 length:318 start_codon:yes stop_codon:yes gene_type:complete
MSKNTKRNKGRAQRDSKGRFLSVTQIAKRAASNRNATISNADLVNSTGVRTFTKGRDVGSMNVSVVTPLAGGTSLKIYSEDYFLQLNGREARTVYRVLSRHFGDV